MRRALALAIVAMLAVSAPAYAQGVREDHEADLKPMADTFRVAWKAQPGKAATTSVPLFGRVLQFDVPAGFVPVYRAQNATGFIMEFVPDGQKVESWSRLVTVTSSVGPGTFALDDAELAKALIGSSTGCAGYAHFEILRTRRIDDELSEVLLSKACGAVAAGAYALAPSDAGEQAIIQFYRDKESVFSVQYAERGKGFAKSGLPISSERAARISESFGKVVLCPPKAMDAVCKDVLMREAVRKGGN